MKTITYDGVSLIKAMEKHPVSASLITTSDLWYLDNPGLVYTAGQIVISVEGNGNNYVHTALALKGTAPGFAGASAIATGTPGVSLDVSATNSMVISWLTLGGSGNTASTATTIQPNSPAGATRFGGVATSGNYAGHTFSRSSGLSPGIKTFSFNTPLTDVVCLAAEFLAAEIPASAYQVWAAQFSAANLTDPAADFDGGSLPTGIEWVVGGDPTDARDDAALLPTLNHSMNPDGKLLFTFRRTNRAAADSKTAIRLEYSNTIGGWTTAAHQGTGANDITISEEPGGFAPGIDRVTVALPASLAGNGKLFARLKVAVASE